MAQLGLRSDRAVGEALREFARDILTEGRAALTNRQLTDAVAVHDFRKAMKRWRAFLRLMEPIVGPDAGRLRFAARDLARELSGARDAQAALDALADMAKIEGALAPRTLAAISAKLEESRAAAETVALAPAMRERMRASLEESSRAVTHWLLDETAFEQVADGITKSYARACHLIPQEWATAQDEPLHELRARVVVLRYQMPLIQPLWPRYAKLWSGEAQRLRERLGTHQDITVLAALTEPKQVLARWRTRLAPLIAARKAAHVAASARIAGRLFADRPKAYRQKLLALWASSRNAA
jgi:CHAD domain-containing protein